MRNNTIYSGAGFLFLLLSMSMVALAQEETDLQNPKNTIWGATALLGNASLNTSSYVEHIDLSDNSGFMLGIFAHSTTFDLQLNLTANSVGLDLEYQLIPNVYLVGNCVYGLYGGDGYGKGQFGSGSNPYFDDINVFQYAGGLGFHHNFGRIQFKLDGLIGGIQSSEKVQQQQEYFDYYFYENNARTMATESYELSSTFLYGGRVSLEMLPRFKKRGRGKFLFSPYVMMETMRNDNAHLKRSVYVEEWLPGNVVYQESSDDTNISYDVETFEFRIGVKCYFY